MHETVMEELRVRSSGKSEYVRDRLGAVQADPVVLPLIETLDVYGRMGRFCYLDLLGDEPESWVSSKAAWAKIESAALNDRVVAALHSAAMTNVGDNDVWSRFIRGLNDRIASAIEELWTMVAVCGQNHALGETGRTFGFEVHPNAVGRQQFDIVKDFAHIG
jgi:hypothetical protein